jgi:hypothetical protein
MTSRQNPKWKTDKSKIKLYKVMRGYIIYI